ncbi:3-ketoacyl-CoA thiolase [Enhygromyxa salina]|uniref:3-ketoacyl-CoA thiolase n=1 Tax=Enhygromyxa salina TaxID=215803 RepID=A0A0C2DDA9_9BACT|nr:acetyl-CoA C-acetyltransferase [Enhygromyxa salina]KIG17682.1 3-ketoacyl-CoA thiolase [Enhygromyxa salina]
MSEAMIFDAVRTPRGKGKSSGSLYTVRPVDLLATTLRALRDRNELDTTQVDDVIAGCVTQTGEQGSCIARFAALTAGYPLVTSGVTLNRFCASGLEACNQAAAMVASGFEDLVIGSGVESMSRVPMGSDGGAIWDPQTQWEVGSVPQGVSADLLATLRGFTREDVDSFAVNSQQKAAAAIERGDFDKSLVPVTDRNGLTMLAKDEYPRPGTDLAALAKLKASFEMMGRQFGLDALTKPVYPQVERIEHVHHAGNSSGIVDGAAAILFGSREKGESLGLKPRAKIRAVASIGSEPMLMLDGPIPVTRKILQRAGMSISDIDLFEVNEAFAAVPMAYLQEFEIDPAKLNVNGGAIALGHPLGATGCMLLGTLLDALEQHDKNVGLVTLCIGGGMGVATIIERV